MFLGLTSNLGDMKTKNSGTPPNTKTPNFCLPQNTHNFMIILEPYHEKQNPQVLANATPLVEFENEYKYEVEQVLDSSVLTLLSTIMEGLPNVVSHLGVDQTY